ncbi:cadherin-related family member 1-like [Ptychodera flava]|uniref:cadherin-related family member 1-like n=1 Tax=Ptychodera flava TaxID=63121 RepID=UPI003969C89D
MKFLILLLIVLEYTIDVEGNLPPRFAQIPDTNPQKYYNMDEEQFPEDFPVGDRMYTLIAEDPDGDPVTFSLSAGSTFFDVCNQNDTHAAVFLKRELDYETAASHHVTWFLNDGLNTPVEEDVIVYVTTGEVNENAPEFIGTPYSTFVPEDETVGTTVQTVSATDSDSGQSGHFVFHLEETEDSQGMFDLMTDPNNSTIAYLILNSTLDFETEKGYKPVVVATDLGVDPGPLSSSATVTVTVGDVQDTPPRFIFHSYSAKLKENKPENTTALEVQAVDGDIATPQDIEFIIPDNTDFWIETVHGSPSRGIIRTKVMFDRESMTEDEFPIVFTVIAQEIDFYNQTLNATTSSTTVAVMIDDVNDMPPAFEKDHYFGEIGEQSPKHSVIANIDIQIEDPDEFDNGRFQIQLVGDECEAELAFYVTPVTALNKAYVVIRVQNELFLDISKYPSFHFKIYAEETHTTEKFNSTADVTIDVIPFPCISTYKLHKLFSTL